MNYKKIQEAKDQADKLVREIHPIIKEYELMIITMSMSKILISSLLSANMTYEQAEEGLKTLLLDYKIHLDNKKKE